MGDGQASPYDPAVAGGVALDQVCPPEALEGRVYYQPVARGMEIKLKEKLDSLREARAAARAGRGAKARGGEGA